MTNDLVKRLRNRAESWLEYECEDDAKIDTEAANHIEQLEAVLLLIANTDPAGDQHWPGRIARAALEKKDEQST
jgi:hypothetical protein